MHRRGDDYLTGYRWRPGDRRNRTWPQRFHFNLLQGKIRYPCKRRCRTTLPCNIQHLPKERWRLCHFIQSGSKTGWYGTDTVPPDRNGSTRIQKGSSCNWSCEGGRRKAHKQRRRKVHEQIRPWKDGIGHTWRCRTFNLSGNHWRKRNRKRRSLLRHFTPGRRLHWRKAWNNGPAVWKCRCWHQAWTDRGCPNRTPLHGRFENQPWRIKFPEKPIWCRWGLRRSSRSKPFRW